MSNDITKDFLKVIDEIRAGIKEEKEKIEKFYFLTPNGKVEEVEKNETG